MLAKIYWAAKRQYFALFHIYIRIRKWHLLFFPRIFTVTYRLEPSLVLTSCIPCTRDTTTFHLLCQNCISCDKEQFSAFRLLCLNPDTKQMCASVWNGCYFAYEVFFTAPYVTNATFMEKFTLLFGKTIHQSCTANHGFLHHVCPWKMNYTCWNSLRSWKRSVYVFLITLPRIFTGV